MRQAPGDGETQTEELAEPDYQYIYICVKKGSDPYVEPEVVEGDADGLIIDGETEEAQQGLIV